MDLLEQLQALPDGWALVAVGANKRPYQPGWQDSPLTKAQVADEIHAGRALAVGVLAGPASGGLLFVDHDGASATDVLASIGAPLADLPKSVAFTSGRPGRFQIAYRVPPEHWPAMAGRRVIKSGKLDADGKAEQLEFRWTGHQSVVIGAHPTTAGYRWLKDRAPGQQALADAPLVLIKQLLDTPEPEPTPLLSQPPSPIPSAPPPAGGPLPLLDFVTRDSRELVESGGTPGSWNDDQLRLALDLCGTEAWLLAQGHRPDITASQAFALHVQAAAAKARDFDERKAWHRFDGAADRSPTPGTPHEKLAERLRYHTRSSPPRPKAATPLDPPDSPPRSETATRAPAGSAYFTCLGFDADAYYYQPHATGQVMRLSRSAHTGTNLVALAPLSYWGTLYPGKASPCWTAAASDLFAQQAAVGVYAADRIRGRGSWWDQGRAVLHLGDRLLVDGAPRPVLRPLPGSTALYQRLSALQGPGDAAPLTNEEASMVAFIAERFHWEVPASGMLLAGWVTLAPICGALPWRPHVWLTAAAGSGKSAILDRFVAPLLGDFALTVAGNTTEPGIRQALRADALPVVFDEAESNERPDQQRMQAILGLARVASSESRAATLKGSPEGDTQRYCVRSMFLLSSIATALRQGADRSRFAQLTLRSPHEIPKAERIAHWLELDRDLDRTITDEFGRRLQARTIALLPMIRAAIRIFTRAAAEHFDSQRLGDQYGTLLAGAWSLQNSEPPSDDEAQRMIAQNSWESYSQATETPDEQRCLQRILQHQLRVEANDRAYTRTMGELVEIVLGRRHDRELEPRQAADALSRHGLRADPAGQLLLVSNTAEAIATILRETAWAHSWATVLARLPGATRTGAVRFSGAGTVSRAVALPAAEL